jgi:hypothetical protein
MKRGFTGRSWLSTATLVVGTTLCTIAGSAGTARAADVAVSDEARLHFNAGVALLQDPKAPRYEEAYREFKTAYAISPSYKILSNLGLCAMKIERDSEAINAFQAYLKEAPDLKPEEKAQMERDLLTLKTGHVEVTVSSDPPGATIVDARTPIEGQEVRNSYGELTASKELGLRHGHHIITARLRGYQDQTWEFDAAGSAMSPHVFHMEMAQSNAVVMVKERPLSTGVVVSGIATLGLTITGAVMGVVALQRHNDFNNLNGMQPQSVSQSAKDSGQTLNIATDAVFGTAIVGAVLTTILFASRPTVERPATAQVTQPSFLPYSVAPTFSPQGGGASAAWIF